MSPEVRDHLSALERGLHAEKDARRAAQKAGEEIARALRELRQCGLTSGQVAGRVARLLGEPEVTPRIRRRIASWLRVRASRATKRCGNQAAPHGREQIGRPSCSGNQQEEASMPKLLKKTTTVTEEFIDEKAKREAEAEEEFEYDSDDSDEEEGDEDEKEEKKPSRKKGR